MLTARSLRSSVAIAGVLAAVALTGAQAAGVPAMSTPDTQAGIVQVHEKGTCWKGYYWYHYCRKWGYNYGEKYCVKWGHRRGAYCGGGSYGGGTTY